MLSKPEWCPADIWTTSVRAAGGEEFAYQAVAEGAARLVCNERERCAKVAEGFPGWSQPRDVAAAIRNGTEYLNGTR